MRGPETPLEVLERWEAHGGSWRVLTQTDSLAVLELCTCYGAPVEQVRSRDPDLIRFLSMAGCSQSTGAPEGGPRPQGSARGRKRSGNRARTEMTSDVPTWFRRPGCSGCLHLGRTAQRPLRPRAAAGSHWPGAPSDARLSAWRKLAEG